MDSQKNAENKNTQDKNIEVEIRSFISKEKYEQLLTFFKKEGKFLYDDEQETHYFDTEQDVRIQKNKFYSKICIKKGKVHDEARQETEIQCAKEDFDKLESLFTLLGHSPKIKWFRARSAFSWEDTTVALDFTKGYGFIIELEKMAKENEKEQVISWLKQKMQVLKVDLTPKEEFEKRFLHYKENWKMLLSQDVIQ